MPNKPIDSTNRDTAGVEVNGSNTATPSTELDGNREFNTPSQSPRVTGGKAEGEREAVNENRNDDSMARSEQWSEGRSKRQTLPPYATRK